MDQIMRQFLAWAQTQPAVAVSLDRLAEWAQHATSAALDSKQERQIAARDGAVAVVPIAGVIAAKRSIFEMLGLEVSTDTISKRVRTALADPNVKAVVLDIDSPGGSAAGVEELVRELRGLRGQKPIIAQVDYLAASAAYWIATAADEIVASPSALVGSVGVYTLHVDQSKFLEDLGVQVTLIADPAEKVDGNPFQPLSETAQEEIRGRVSQAADVFRADVAEGRGLRRNQVTPAWARVYTAKDALSMGMIDKVRSLRDTLARLGVASEPERAGQRARAAAARERELAMLWL